MTVHEIIREYLEREGYDGLCGDECDRGCGSVFTCDYPDSDCEPAYLWDCSKCTIIACEYYFDGHGCYRPVKQEVK